MGLSAVMARGTVADIDEVTGSLKSFRVGQAFVLMYSPPVEPHTLSQAEIRDAILKHGLTADPSIQFGSYHDWLFGFFDPQLNDGRFKQLNSAAHRALKERWYGLNPDVEDLIAEVASGLFVSGLIGHTSYYLSSQQFRLTEAGRRLAEEEVPILGDGQDGVPEGVLDVWREAVDCYPARPRAAALLLGVAAEMVIAMLAERLRDSAPSTEKSKLGRWQISEKRAGCVAILRNADWKRTNGVSDGPAKSAGDALEMLGTLYSWTRDEQAHARSVAPPGGVLYPMLNAFPSYCRTVLAIHPLRPV